MKDKTKIAWVVLLSLLLAGCGMQRFQPVRVITRVDVSCDRGYQVMRRQYTNSEKISMVLNYLRLQKDLGPPERNPESTPGERVEIDVTLSDGTHRFYYQHAGEFLSEKNQNWHEIDPELASGFQLRLQMIPTDAKPLPRRTGV